MWTLVRELRFQDNIILYNRKSLYEVLRIRLFELVVNFKEKNNFRKDHVDPKMKTYD